MIRYLKSLMWLIVCVAFMSMVCLIAAFIGPNHGVEIKILIGMTVGAMILGRRFPDAIITLYFATYGLLRRFFE